MDKDMDLNIHNPIDMDHKPDHKQEPKLENQPSGLNKSLSRPKRRRKTHLAIYQSKTKRRHLKPLNNNNDLETQFVEKQSLIIEDETNQHISDDEYDTCLSDDEASLGETPNHLTSKKLKTETTEYSSLSSTLKKSIGRAPEKTNKPKIPKLSKKTLEFGFDYKTESENRIKDVAEKLVDVLSSGNLLNYFMLLIEQLVDGTFSLTNIALLLLLERAKLQSVNSTTNMIYLKDTLVFWKVVYKLFGGAAIRLFSGPKHSGQVIAENESKGSFDPTCGDINFAVPDLKTLRNSDLPYAVPKNVEPGIISEAVRLIANKKNKEFILAVDGKKVAQGLNNDCGDINMWGYESPKLKDEKLRLEDDVNICKAIGKECELDLDTCLHNIKSDNIRQTLHTKLKEVAKVNTKRIEDLRKMILSQNFLSTKLQKMSDENPSVKDKYVFAINKTKAVTHQAESIVKKLLQTNQDICKIGCDIQGELNYNGKLVVDMGSQNNIIHLQNPADLSEEFKMSCYVKQHSEEWHNLRKLAPVTGSTLYNAIGLRTLKDQKNHIKMFKGDLKQEFTPEVQEMLDHGSSNEINAIATFSGQVLPFLFPNARFFEEGPHFISDESEDRVLIEVSPDGAIRNSANELLCSIEIKCPITRSFKLPVLYSVPHYYVLQVMAEMVAQQTDSVLFISYSKESMTVSKALFDTELWQAVMAEVELVYAKDEITIPTKTSRNVKKIKDLISKFLTKNVDLLIEVPSQLASDICESDLLQISPYMYANRKAVLTKAEITVRDMVHVCDQSAIYINEGNMICRKKASEILAFIITDSDRLSTPEYPHHLPIAYAMKGYSMSASILREMCEDVKEECSKNSVSILCESFDGQWHSVTVRDKDGNPLTRLELQKDIWRESCKLTKLQQLNILKDLFVANKENVNDVLTVTYNDGKANVTTHDNSLGLYITPRNLKLWHKPTKNVLDKNAVNNCDVQEALENARNEIKQGIPTVMETGIVNNEIYVNAESHEVKIWVFIATYSLHA